MNENTENVTPVRQPVFANIVPIPQTTTGTLEHTGTAYDTENITDIPPDFSWMSEMPFYRSQIEWPYSSDQGIIINLNKFKSTADSASNSFPWLAVPMSLHRYFNGEFFIRMTAVKPSRTPGKILVTYVPNGKVMSKEAINLVKARVVKKEWDLAQSNTFELTIPGFNPSRMRVTSDRRRDPPTGHDGVSLQGPSCARDYGAIILTDAIPYAPGSIFPDKFTIFFEYALQRAEFATPCDSHGVYRDFFSITN